jgi:hypothetical protein
VNTWNTASHGSLDLGNAPTSPGSLDRPEDEGKYLNMSRRTDPTRVGEPTFPGNPEGQQKRGNTSEHIGNMLESDGMHQQYVEKMAKLEQTVVIYIGPAQHIWNVSDSAGTHTSLPTSQCHECVKHMLDRVENASGRVGTHLNTSRTRRSMSKCVRNASRHVGTRCGRVRTRRDPSKHLKTPECIETCRNTSKHVGTCRKYVGTCRKHVGTHRNTLKTRRNTSKHVGTRRKHAETRRNASKRVRTRRNTSKTLRNTLERVGTRQNTLERVENTPKHAGTRRNTLERVETR